MRNGTVKAVGFMVLLSAIIAHADQVVIKNFATQSAYYPYYKSDTNVAATVVWTSSGYNSVGALKITYSFPPGSRYCMYQCTPVPALTGNETGVSFMARDAVGARINVRIIDNTNQTHQYWFELVTSNWEKLQIPLNGGRSDGWGGADDGIIHPPVKRIEIGPHVCSNTAGTLYIDEIYAYTGNEVVKVDFTVDKGPVSGRASGFLHAMTPQYPVPAMVDPLKPKLFRMNSDTAYGGGAFNCAQRVAGLGARMQYVLSDDWWTNPGFPGDNGNWTAWENVVRNSVNRILDGNYNFELDVWNEPDSNWQRTVSQWNEMWRRAVNLIRPLYQARGKTAKIVGPSLAYFDYDWLQNFLLYARDNNVLPDTLSWHEMSWNYYYYKNIPSHVADMRDFMSANNISISHIDLNEIIGTKFTYHGYEHIMQTNPGLTAWVLVMVDSAQVDGACHACWPDYIGSNCTNNTLDGLLSCLDYQPRSTWWVYKGYADLAGTLVGVDPSASVGLIASHDPTNRVVRVLLGRDLGTAGNVNLEFNNLDRIAYLSEAGSVWVKAERIPNSGWNSLAAPLIVINAAYPIVGNQVKVVLPGFGIADAYTVQLTAVPVPVTVQGTVVLDGYTGDYSGVGVTVELRNISGPIRTEKMLLGGDGRFVVSNVDPGTYDVAVKSAGWLQQVVTGVDATVPVDLGILMLVSGDVDGDNEITTSDLASVLFSMDLMGDL